MSFNLTATETTVTIRVNVVDGYDMYRVFFRPETDTTAESRDFTTTENFTTTFTGLSSSTAYVANVIYTTSEVGWTSYEMMGAQTITTLTPITPWSWSSSNGSATATQTATAYTAVTEKGAVADFSYMVWNDLCSKAAEVRDRNGLSWSTTYATLANTKMSSSDKAMTAIRFNSLLINVNRLSSTGVSVRSTGDFILGSYFTTLASAINAAI